MTFLIDPFILFFRSHFYLKASLFAPTTTFLPLWMYRPRLVGQLLGDDGFLCSGAARDEWRHFFWILKKQRNIWNFSTFFLSLPAETILLI